METKTDAIGVIVLAAGASRRMGRPKQLLQWRHTTLLGHSIDEALQLTKDVVVVLGANFEQIKKQIKNKPVGIVQNNAWQDGMGTSIALGVSELIRKKAYTGILIMLADQPLLDAFFLKKIVGSFYERNVKIAATDYGHDKGVPAIFHQSLFKELRKLNQDFGARKLMKGYRSEIVGVAANSKAADIDTQEDYDNLIKENSPK